MMKMVVIAMVMMTMFAMMIVLMVIDLDGLLKIFNLGGEQSP